jgi:hypothetical protein
MNWIDTKEIRQKEVMAFVFTNDIYKTINSDFLDALKHYDICKLIPWSKKENFKERLAA